MLMWALSVSLAVAAMVLLAIGSDGLLSDRPADLFSGLGGTSFVLLSLTYATVGMTIARRVPDNPIGIVFCVAGLVTAVNLVTWQYTIVGLYTTHQLPGTTSAMVVNGFVGEQNAGWMALSLLLFPHGRVSSRRARAALAVAIAGLALLVVAGAFTPGAYDPPFSALSNPIGFGSRGLFEAINIVAWLLVLAGLGAGTAALVVRRRRARGIERRQLELVLLVGSIAAGVTAALMSSWLFWPEGALPVRMAVLGFVFAAFPLAVGAAILRRGLYGIEVAINRTLVYGSVTLLLAGAFAGTALVLGTALGRGSPVVAAVATLVAATAFRPLRARMQDLVDRRFNRARYDAVQRMAAFLEALRSGHAAPEEVESLLRELAGDPTLELRFFESGLYVDAQGAAPSSVSGRVKVPIERDGQPLGQVVHAPLGEEQAVLLRRLVEAGGLAIEIVRLRVELRRRLAEVEASRARIVEAGNAERRRIERDLHDGAQQRLVSIGLDLRHAQHRLGPSGEILDRAVDEITYAIAELRELASGLPPSQLDAGLGPALRELAGRAPLPVSVEATGERFSTGVEAAAYFIACEGLTNAIKHARATSVVMSASRTNGSLVVRVSDDGVGGAREQAGSGLSGLRDRVAAHGGSFEVRSGGPGTTLVAELPCGS